jgi:hypothetical protein
MESVFYERQQWVNAVGNNKKYTKNLTTYRKVLLIIIP